MTRLIFGVLFLLCVWPCPAAAADDSLIPFLTEYASPAVVNIESGDGTGSGFIVSPAGYLLTNSHVVKDQTTVAVTLAGGERLSAAVIATGPQDVALLKVDRIGLPSLRLGSSKTIKQGETIIMLGSPKGLPNSVSRGIVSYPRRERNGESFIQLDVAINPGNSGGPILNMRGEVIGLATMLLKDSQGIGFVLPIEAAFPLLAAHNVPVDTSLANADIALRTPSTGEIAAPAPAGPSYWYYVAGCGVSVIVVLAAGCFWWRKRRQRDVPVVLRPKTAEQDVDIDLH